MWGPSYIVEIKIYIIIVIESLISIKLLYNDILDYEKFKNIIKFF